MRYINLRYSYIHTNTCSSRKIEIYTVMHFHFDLAFHFPIPHMSNTEWDRRTRLLLMFAASQGNAETHGQWISV